MAEILDLPDNEWQDEEGNPLPETERRFARLDVQTAIALQIALATGEFRVGRYTRGVDYDRWKRKDSSMDA